MTDELSPPPTFLERVTAPGISEDQANTVAKRSRLAWMTLDRIYAQVQSSDAKMTLGSDEVNIFDGYRQQVNNLFHISGENLFHVSRKKLLEGEHQPIVEQKNPSMWRALSDKLSRKKKRLSLPSSEITATPELLSHVTPEETQAMATASAESGALLCHALMGTILHHYDYHLTQWKTKHGRNELTHPQRMLEYLLITYVGLNGEPDPRLVIALEQKTGVQADKWKFLIKRCLEENEKEMKASSVLDILEPRGPVRS